MSHMVRDTQIVIKDLEALKRACQALGLQWKEGQATARYYRGVQSGYVHAIGVPGTNWEIGVSRTKGGFTLEADFWGENGRIIRKHYNQLLQRYSTEVIKRLARLKGQRVVGKQKGKNIVLEVMV